MSPEPQSSPRVVQLVLVEPEEVADLVDEGDADLLDELGAAAREALEVPLEQHDRRGQVRPGIHRVAPARTPGRGTARGSTGESGGSRGEEVVLRGQLLDGDRDVREVAADLLRQLRERVLHRLVERRRRERDRRAGTRPGASLRARAKRRRASSPSPRRSATRPRWCCVHGSSGRRLLRAEQHAPRLVQAAELVERDPLLEQHVDRAGQRLRRGGEPRERLVRIGRAGSAPRPRARRASAASRASPARRASFARAQREVEPALDGVPVGLVLRSRFTRRSAAPRRTSRSSFPSASARS